MNATLIGSPCRSCGDEGDRLLAEAEHGSEITDGTITAFADRQDAWRESVRAYEEGKA